MLHGRERGNKNKGQIVKNCYAANIKIFFFGSLGVYVVPMTFLVT